MILSIQKGDELMQLKVGIKYDDKWQYNRYIFDNIENASKMICSILANEPNKITIERIVEDGV